jgi:hypothetical protein
MEYLWSTYGIPMEQHRTNTVAIPGRFGVSKALESGRARDVSRGASTLRSAATEDGCRVLRPAGLVGTGMDGRRAGADAARGGSRR